MKKGFWREAAVLALAPLLMLLALESLARGNGAEALLWALRRPLVFGMQYALLLGVCLVGCAFRRQGLRASFWLTAAFFCVLLGIANHYKLMYRMEPVLLSDLGQVGDAAATVRDLDFQIDFVQIAIFGALFVAALVLCNLRWRGRLKTRYALPPLVGLALVIALPLLCTFDLAGSSVDVAEHARNDGCLYTALATENNRRAQMRVRYERQEVEADYREIARLAEETEAGGDGQRPNVIFVLSEAFMDGDSLIPYLDLTRPLTPFFDSLAAEAVTGRLYVPKIGGGTSETEFEVLTGLRSKYSVNPYTMGLPPVSSAASLLRDKGYAATAIHWYAGVYYNRIKNLRMQGFDAFYTTDTTTRPLEKAGMFVADSEHYRAIMRQLRATGSRDFVYCITMQNHGGYGYDDFRQTYGAQVPFTNALSPESEKIVSNYCYLLGRSDEALKMWIEELRAFEEPTVVVFFGDHLAPMGTQVYEELGMDLAGDGAHLTPYFIWSNRGLSPERLDMYSYQLGAYALTLAGLCDDPFLCYVERLRREGVQEDERYDLLSYDVLFGSQYAYGLAGLSPESEDFQMGGKMTLTGFDAAAIGDGVYVRPRLADPDQKYKLSVNGALRDVNFVQETSGPVELQCVLTGSYGRRENESGVLRYEGTAELLENSGTLDWHGLPLWESEYQLVRDRWYQSYVVYQSADTFACGSMTAALLGGERLDWQPVYGIRKGGQYGVDGSGRVFVAIEKSALRQQTAEGVREYLREQQAQLIVFD